MSIFKCSRQNSYLHGEFTEVFLFLKEWHMASSFVRINCEAKPVPMKSGWHINCVEQLCVTISIETALYLLSLYSPEDLILPLLFLFYPSDQLCYVSCVMSLSYLQFWERQMCSNVLLRTDAMNSLSLTPRRHHWPNDRTPARHSRTRPCRDWLYSITSWTGLCHCI